MMGTEIRTKMPFEIGGALGVHWATFTWHPADPLIVKAKFTYGDDPLDVADWSFSRELLLEGLTAILNVGEGDVKVRSDAYQYVFTLTSPDGRGQVFIERNHMREFLEETTAAVLDGSVDESDRMDAWIELAIHEIMNEES